MSYLRIPALDARQSAGFYEAVFGWTVGGNPDRPSFEDGTGHVIGHFMTDLSVAGEAGILPFIYVERVDETVRRITACGGVVTKPPYREGDLWVATFRDPAGNALGVWQRGPRRLTRGGGAGGADPARRSQAKRRRPPPRAAGS